VKFAVCNDYPYGGMANLFLSLQVNCNRITFLCLFLLVGYPQSPDPQWPGNGILPWQNGTRNATYTDPSVTSDLPDLRVLSFHVCVCLCCMFSQSGTSVFDCIVNGSQSNEVIIQMSHNSGYENRVLNNVRFSVYLMIAVHTSSLLAKHLANSHHVTSFVGEKYVADWLNYVAWRQWRMCIFSDSSKIYKYFNVFIQSTCYSPFNDSLMIIIIRLVVDLRKDKVFLSAGGSSFICG